MRDTLLSCQPAWHLACRLAQTMRRAAARTARCCRVRPAPTGAIAAMRRASSTTTIARPRRLRSPLPPPPLLPQRSRDDPGLYRVATVPNALSAFRIAAAPAVGALVWHGHHDAAALAGCALSLTDWLDGYLAQKLDQETICVEIKILRRARAESSHHPPRHRRDACSMAWRCRFLTARPSQDLSLIHI